MTKETSITDPQTQEFFVMAEEEKYEEHMKNVAYLKRLTATALIDMISRPRGTEKGAITPEQADCAISELICRAPHYNAIDTLLVTAQEAGIYDGKPYALPAYPTGNEEEDVSIAVVPAQPGWFAPTVDGYGTLDKEPVIAWRISKTERTNALPLQSSTRKVATFSSAKWPATCCASRRAGSDPP
jgi:hypothetical protein